MSPFALKVASSNGYKGRPSSLKTEQIVLFLPNRYIRRVAKGKTELQCHRVSLGLYFVTGFIKHIHLASGTGSELQKLNSSANENHLCGHLVPRTWKYQVLATHSFPGNLKVGKVNTRKWS